MKAYTQKQKTNALNLYLEHGTAETARRTKISPATITRWAQAAGISQLKAQKTEAAREALAAKNAERREHIKDTLLNKMADMLGRMDEPHIDFRGKDIIKVTFPKATSGDVKNYAVSFGILLDKYRLEMGESTSRTDVSVAVAESVLDQEIIRLSEQHATQPS